MLPNEQSPSPLPLPNLPVFVSSNFSHLHRFRRVRLLVVVVIAAAVIILGSGTFWFFHESALLHNQTGSSTAAGTSSSATANSSSSSNTSSKNSKAGSGTSSSGSSSGNTSGNGGSGGSASVKSDIIGLIDRGKDPSGGVGSNFTWPLPSGWAGNPITGIVVNVAWSDLQPHSANSTIVASANSTGSNVVDRAISDIEAWNAANPSKPLAIKIRVYAGEYAPAWAKAIGGPITGNSGNTIGAFWTSSFVAAWANLMHQLSGLYDSNPVIKNVTGSGCMTLYSEPMLHDDFNNGSGLNNLINAGYNDNADYNCLMADVTALQAWKQTHVSVSMNPWQLLTLGGGETISGVSCTTSTCSALTDQFMGNFATSLTGRTALQNDSIRYLPISTYSDMYANIINQQNKYGSEGLTVDYQTATLSKLEGGSVCGSSAACEGLSEALNWACGATDGYQTTGSGQRASSVELPAGYTSAVYSPYDNFTTPSSYGSYLNCLKADPHG